MPQFVFSTLPKVVFRMVTTLIFLIGETMFCLVSTVRDNKPRTIELCDDVVNCNYTGLPCSPLRGSPFSLS